MRWPRDGAPLDSIWDARARLGALVCPLRKGRIQAQFRLVAATEDDYCSGDAAPQSCGRQDGNRGPVGRPVESSRR